MKLQRSRGRISICGLMKQELPQENVIPKLGLELLEKSLWIIMLPGEMGFEWFGLAPDD